MEIKDTVLSVLLQKPYTRKNNGLLIEEVYRRLYGWFSTEDARYVPFGEIMHMTASGILPQLETITRTARKIKQEYPNLR